MIDIDLNVLTKKINKPTKEHKEVLGDYRYI